MEKSVAVRKLHKILGKGFAYRVNPKAGTREDREKAKAELKAANAARDKAREALEQRRLELITADQEYQDRLAAKQAAEAVVRRLHGIQCGYRVTVGTVDKTVPGFSMFVVKAEGDNWQEVFDKVSKA